MRKEKKLLVIEFVKFVVLVVCSMLSTTMATESAEPLVLKADSFKHYIDTFNKDDEELFVQHIPNEKAWEFLKANIPLFECPDKDFELTYYFRWWTYRKHIKETPDGFVITEFLPKVGWGGKHNEISCAAGHHFYEGRWLHTPKYLDDYAVYWFQKGGSPRQYSCWLADALYARYLVRPDKKLVTDLLDNLVYNYKEWEKEKLASDGLFWQIDDKDGMEFSISGSAGLKMLGEPGKRPSINSYMYGDAMAIAGIAELAERQTIAQEYRAKAERLKQLIQTKLWNDGEKFFMTLPRDKETLVNVREEIGFTPWYFNLPQHGYEEAWKQLMDPEGFYAPFGPTTAEQRHPQFAVRYEGHSCQWNGPSWPYATSITLTALANVLNSYEQDVINRADYFETLKIYTKSHRLKREDGQLVPWIDENLNPYTGDWIARTRLSPVVRGKDYNHSSYCDLVISGLVGLRPRPDDIVEVNPLLPADMWDWFCLDNVLYHGHIITILWDCTGTKYGKGKGLHIFADGEEIVYSSALSKVSSKLNAKVHEPNPLKPAEYAEPYLWREIKAPQSLLAEEGFAGDMRVGDLNGDGNVEFVLFRSTGGNMKPCFIAAFDINGQELWHDGIGGEQPQRPGPVTVYDFEGGGRAEVLCFFINSAIEAPSQSMANVVVQVREGLTGKVIRQAAPAQMCQCSGEGANWVHQRLLIANFRGTKRPEDFAVKLGSKVLAFTKDLDVLWTYEIRWNEYGKCSAYVPAVGDIDGDNRDEVNGGYYLLDDNGQPLWEGQLAENMDSVDIAPWDDGKMRAICSGHGYVLDSRGNVILCLGKELVPHGQEVRVADFDKSLYRPEMIIRYNGHNPHVIVVANSGKVVRRFQLNYSPNYTGMEAVYWNGRDKAALLYNGGVLWSSDGQRFSNLPGLPEPIGETKMGWYHCIPANVCGDEREEMVLYNPWDQYVWIFTPAPVKSTVFGGYHAGPRQYNPRLMD